MLYAAPVSGQGPFFSTVLSLTINDKANPYQLMERTLRRILGGLCCSTTGIKFSMSCMYTTPKQHVICQNNATYSKRATMWQYKKNNCRHKRKWKINLVLKVTFKQHSGFITRNQATIQYIHQHNRSHTLNTSSEILTKRKSIKGLGPYTSSWGPADIKSDYKSNFAFHKYTW